jgi:hypothetical protein
LDGWEQQLCWSLRKALKPVNHGRPSEQCGHQPVDMMKQNANRHAVKDKPRRTRFASVTKGIRLRTDQMEALERLMGLDPELDWSKAVRRGLDLFLAEHEQRLKAKGETPSKQMRITREDVAAKLRGYLRHELPVADLVAWADRTLRDAELDANHFDAIHGAVAKLGSRDVKESGLNWEDCEAVLKALGYSVQVDVVNT